MTSLKHTFEQNAADYRRFRPTYPQAIAADIVKLSSLQHGAHILEIGCGAGQATDLFSHLRPVQTSIDIGPNLLEQCRRWHGHRPGYRFVCASFEDFEGPLGGHDLIYAATCFHWLTPVVRFEKSHALLKAGGHLAVFSDKHLKNRDGFFADVQGCYETHAPELAAGSDQQNRPSDASEDNPLLLVTEREYDRELIYTADEYVGLLRTFAGHIALGESRLMALCDAIHTLICARHGGTVTKILTTRLKFYKKTPTAGLRGPS
jgi:SAM-dependent methyltransferase